MCWVKGSLSYSDVQKQGMKVRYTNITCFNGGIVKKDKVENFADKAVKHDDDMPDMPDDVSSGGEKDDLEF